MFLLELCFFVFHPPRIKPEKKDRVFDSDLKVKWRFRVSCFAVPSRNLRRPLGWHCSYQYDIMRFDFLQGRQVDSLLVPSALRSSLVPLALNRALCTRFIQYFWFISGVFAFFKFLSCPYGLYIVPLPKIIASQLVASLLNRLHQVWYLKRQLWDKFCETYMHAAKYELVFSKSTVLINSKCSNFLVYIQGSCYIFLLWALGLHDLAGFESPEVFKGSHKTGSMRASFYICIPGMSQANSKLHFLGSTLRKNAGFLH